MSLKLLEFLIMHEEVKALRQEKHALQQKLQEAEVKWSHFIAQQGLQVTLVTV